VVGNVGNDTDVVIVSVPAAFARWRDERERAEDGEPCNVSPHCSSFHGW
jgi:hypothetical protein